MTNKSGARHFKYAILLAYVQYSSSWSIDALPLLEVLRKNDGIHNILESSNKENEADTNNEDEDPKASHPDRDKIIPFPVPLAIIGGR